MAKTYRRTPVRDYRRAPMAASVYYSPDSTARQLEEYAPPAPAHQPRPRPLPRKRQKPKPEFAYDIQARHRHNFLSYVLVLVFFGGLAVVLALNARFEYDRMALEAARSHLAALNAGNEAREREIYATLDFEEMERLAVEQLGMVQPEDFQLIEIVVQPQSFFSHAMTEEVSTSGFSFSRFWNILFSDRQD